MKLSKDNQIHAQRGAFALLCGTDGQVDQEFLGLAVRNIITNLGHYCDSQRLHFRRINKGALSDWEKQRLANDE